MPKLEREARFLDEHGDEDGILRELRPESLQRNQLALSMLGAPRGEKRFRHAASTDLPDDAVRTACRYVAVAFGRHSGRGRDPVVHGEGAPAARPWPGSLLR